MKVLYSPCINEVDQLDYEFIGDKIIVTYNGQVDEFDFTGMPNGCRVNSYDRKNMGILSDLPLTPVIEAEKADGILKVQLIKFIGLDSPNEEKFPDWIEV